jgi:hypothetical protein
MGTQIAQKETNSGKLIAENRFLKFVENRRKLLAKTS